MLDRLIRPGMPTDLPNKRVLGGGLRAILVLHLRLEGSRPVPAQLRHRLTLAIVSTDGARREETIDAGRVAVSTQRSLAIDPPLRGGDWIAANEPSNASVHRRALLVVNGTPRIAQRVAIDWIKLVQVDVSRTMIARVKRTGSATERRCCPSLTERSS